MFQKKVDDFNLNTMKEDNLVIKENIPVEEDKNKFKVKIYDVLLNRNVELVCNWDLVSDEIMLYIFGFLDNSFDLVNMSLVSKRWNEIGEDNTLWEKLYTVHWSTKLTDFPINEKWKQFYMKKKYDYILSPKKSPEKGTPFQHYGSPTTKKFLLESLDIPQYNPYPRLSSLNLFKKKKKK